MYLEDFYCVEEHDSFNLEALSPRQKLFVLGLLYVEHAMRTRVAPFHSSMLAHIKTPLAKFDLDKLGGTSRVLYFDLYHSQDLLDLGAVLDTNPNYIEDPEDAKQYIQIKESIMSGSWLEPINTFFGHHNTDIKAHLRAVSIQRPAHPEPSDWQQ